MKEKEKKNIKDWIKKHQTELILAGIGTTVSAVLLYIGLKNKEQILEVLKSTSEIDVQRIKNYEKKLPIPSQTEILEISDNLTTQNTYGVEKHIRNLPIGYHASAEKIASAAEQGFELLENQTWVDDYNKGRSVA